MGFSLGDVIAPIVTRPTASTPVSGATPVATPTPGSGETAPATPPSPAVVYQPSAADAGDVPTYAAPSPASVAAQPAPEAAAEAAQDDDPASDEAAQAEAGAAAVVAGSGTPAQTRAAADDGEVGVQAAPTVAASSRVRTQFAPEARPSAVPQDVTALLSSQVAQAAQALKGHRETIVAAQPGAASAAPAPAAPVQAQSTSDVMAQAAYALVAEAGTRDGASLDLIKYA